jgi:hypothetical protein
MTRKERRLINRANAKLSTGPKTDAGKEASGRNATTHGLTSKRVVLPHESQEEFDAQRAALHDQHKPVGEVEKELVDQIAQTWWRLQRAYRIEASFLEQSVHCIENEYAARHEGDDALAQMFLRTIETKQMQLMMRYVAAAERAWNKALSELRRLQAERRKNEKVESKMAIRRLWAAGIASQPQDAAGIASQPKDTEQLTPEVGFVSQLAADAVSEPSAIDDAIAA